MGNVIGNIGIGAGALIPFLYPAYRTLKTIESKNSNEMAKCARYWMNYTAISGALEASRLFINWKSVSLSWIRVGTAIWLLRNNFEASESTYNTYLGPAMNRMRLDDRAEYFCATGMGSVKSTARTLQSQLGHVL
ncbi:hypothetical protein J8273_7433 [Carpediemonas membranifera]|uniref:Uncharacterized protein n=1 Tax=Carpediemonas membranifera TaxID=201153 RepID=A0A8J6AZQ4_9EUKA|nr:hypothetical protein J8273_7433 [Carpediemonas membranifera]|eukprot:KAG9391159.1 hypothetical protein J8273_7433 [Carpediemonas membranifera]